MAKHHNRPFLVIIDVVDLINILEANKDEDDDDSDILSLGDAEPPPMLISAQTPEDAANRAANYCSDYFYEECPERQFVVCDIQNNEIHKYNVRHEGFSIDEIT